MRFKNDLKMSGYYQDYRLNYSFEELEIELKEKYLNAIEMDKKYNLTGKSLSFESQMERILNELYKETSF